MALPAIADFTGSGVTEAQFKSALAELLDYVENEAGGKPGDFVCTGRSTPPTGTIKANGAAVARSVYTNLDAAIYVGDANNATAHYGYRCTNPLNPSASRSVSGAYIVIPDMRGEVMIGWDDGRGVDSGRALLSWRASQNKSHAHSGWSGGAGGHSHSAMGTVANNGYGYSGSADSYSAGGVSTSWVGDHAHGIGIGNEGGTDAMPRTVAVLVCIKY